jgi:DNA repair protein NreA
MLPQLFDSELCVKCRGRGFCNRPCRIYSKIKDFIPKTKTHFSGSSPPEIFVGKFNYPNISAGILSPIDEEISANTNMEFSSPKDTEFTLQQMSFPEEWHRKGLSIDQILTNRAKLIYGRFKTQIKSPNQKNNRFIGIMQETSMAYKPVSTEFFLKKPPVMKLELNRHSAAIGNPAPLEFARFQENPKIKPKVEYLVSDTDAKAANSIIELYKSNITNSNIIKILSAGLLGLKTQRKLVPTRWSITAVDDTISKNLLKKIKYYPEINEILLFHGYYVGNHYEILLLPDKFSFEVMEAYMPGSLWNQMSGTSLSQDFERFSGRKYYANSVTGAYYTMRLALCEYLEKIKRQAYCIVFREERPEYYAPLGVGILRELAREAFSKPPEKFNATKEALNQAQTRLKLPIEIFTNKSVLLKEYKQQKRLSSWF